jgi:hypothetical protein
VTTGRDRFYLQASARHRLSVPFGEGGWPLAVRVARHLAGIGELAASLGEVEPDKAVAVRDLPDYQSVVDRGVGAFLATGRRP